MSEIHEICPSDALGIKQQEPTLTEPLSANS